MTVINTNTAATITANALSKNERAMSQTKERLSTGQRINSAADDAAGFSTLGRSVAYNISVNSFFGSIIQAASNTFSNELTADTFLSMSLGSSSFDYGTL